jgi:ABC-type branched-subunit amino acid transport system ATPase component
MADSPEVAIDSAPRGEPREERPTIRIQEAVKSFHGRVVVDVDDLILGAHPIEGLIGPNGAGKTTLMRMIMHSIKLDQGTITFFPPGVSANGGQVLSDRSSPAIAQLGVVKTNQVIQDFDQLTIWDSLLLSVAKASDERSYEIYREHSLFDDHVDVIRWYLDEFPFEDPYGYANSAGEKKLLDIIRCLLLEPRVLLLDEPAAGLPEDVRDRVMDLIKEKATTESMSVVIVEHDLDVVWNMSDYVHFMAEGGVVLHGTPSYIRQHDTVIEKYLGSGHVGG